MTTNHDHDDDAKTPRWLTPELIIKALTILITLVGLYYGISTKVDRLSEDVQEIRKALPNKELQESKLEEMNKRIAKLESDYGALDTWVRTTREKLAEHGWNPDITIIRR